MFKNARLYKILEAITEIDQGQFNKPYRELTDLQESAFHWAGYDVVSGGVLLTALVQEKLLPPKVINTRVAGLVAEIERTEGRRPGDKEKNELRDKVLNEMLPRAFVQHRRLRAFIDLLNNRVIVDSGTEKDADWIIAQIRESLGSFPVIPMAKQVRLPLTEWYRDEAATPENVVVGGRLELVMGTDPSVKSTHRNLNRWASEIIGAIEDGMGVNRLEIGLVGSISSAMVDVTGTMKSIRYAEVAKNDNPLGDWVIAIGAVREWVKEVDKHEQD